MPKAPASIAAKTMPAAVPRQSQSVEEWAAANGVSVHTAYNYLREKKIPHVRLGRRYLIPLNAMELMAAADAE